MFIVCCLLCVGVYGVVLVGCWLDVDVVACGLLLVVCWLMFFWQFVGCNSWCRVRCWLLCWFVAGLCLVCRCYVLLFRVAVCCGCVLFLVSCVCLLSNVVCCLLFAVCRFCLFVVC